MSKHPVDDEITRALASLPVNNPRPVLLFKDDHTLVYANPAAERMVSQLRLGKVAELLPLEHFRILRELLERPMPGQGHAATRVVRGTTIAWAYRSDPVEGWIHLFANAVERSAASEKEAMALDSALRDDAICPYYQSIIRCEDEGIAGYELLARWLGPGGTVRAPDTFIPQAEALGMVSDIDLKILKAALTRSLELPSDGGQTLSVNISSQTAMSPLFLEALEKWPQQLGAAPARVCVELTESAIVGDPIHAAELLQACRGLGYRIALDDFGTGYSSLSYLQQFPVDRLKIDRSFIGSIVRHQRSRKLVGAIIGLAKALDMETVVEGVETQEQFDVLRDLGADCVQGFFFSKPTPWQPA